MKTQIHLLVTGRVQGVCFRYCCRDEAVRLDVTGWVKNLPDGRVEITAEGDRKTIRDFVAWCRHGPPHAHVTDFNETYTAVTGTFDSFEIRF